MGRGVHKSYRNRCCEIESRFYDDAGNELFSIARLIDWLVKHADIISRYAWVVHDRDVYVVEDADLSLKAPTLELAPAGCWLPIDEELRSIRAFLRSPFALIGALGALKPAHIHCAVEFVNARSYAQIAQELGLPEGQIHKPTAHLPKAMRGYVFEAMAAYQCHQDPEQLAKGKTPYDFAEIHTSGFDYGEMFHEYMNRKTRAKASKMTRSEVNELANAIRRGEKTTRELEEQYGWSFVWQHRKQFADATTDYVLSDDCPLDNRLSMYIGPSQDYVERGGRLAGLGKSALSTEIARALHPEMVNSQDAYHEVTNLKVPYERYRGQPTIVFHESRGRMVAKLGGVENFLNLTDPHPKKGAENIKFGDVVLVSDTLIFEGIQPRQQFMARLAGEYRDKDGNQVEAEALEQVPRRFPLVLELEDKLVRLLINKGVFNHTAKTDDVFEYVVAAEVSCDVGLLFESYAGEALRQTIGPLLDAVVHYVGAYFSLMVKREEDPSKVLAEHKPVVRIYSPEEAIARAEREEEEAEFAEQERLREQLVQQQMRQAERILDSPRRLAEEAKREAEREAERQEQRTRDLVRSLASKGFVFTEERLQKMDRGRIIFDPASQGL
jgi:hypothetical protein